MNTIEQLDELQKKAIHTPELKKTVSCIKKGRRPIGGILPDLSARGL